MAEQAIVRVLADGDGAGEVLRLAEPLSFWGGLDPHDGRIIDHHHPRHGDVVTGRVLVMPTGRGSSSASSVLAEAIRLGTAPAAIVLTEPDPIIAVGALTAAELYGTRLPVIVAPELVLVEGEFVRLVAGRGEGVRIERS